MMKNTAFCLPKIPTNIFLGLFIALSLFGIFIPLQVDEPAWGFQNHMAIKDGFKIITLMPQCHRTSEIAMDLPISWYPYAFVNHILFMQIDAPIWLRIVGIIRFIAFLAVSFFIIDEVAKKLKTNSKKLFIVFLAVLSLDILASLMQVARPEQTLLLGSSILIALALKAKYLLKYKYLAIFSFFFTTFLVFPAHPKALALLPIVLVCGLILFRKLIKSKIITALLLIALTLFVLNSAKIWLQRYDCSYSPESEGFIKNHKLPLEKLSSQPFAFFGEASLNIVSGVLSDLFPYRILFDYNWLPKTLNNIPPELEGIYALISIFSFFLRIVIFVLCLLCTFNVFISLFHKKFAKKFYEQVSYEHAFIATSIFIAVIGLMAIVGREKMWYHGALNAPLLIICGFIFIKSLKVENAKVIASKFSTVLLTLASISIVIFLLKFYPYITKPQLIERSIPNRTIMISPWQYSIRQNNVMTAYNACQLPNLSLANRLILDDYTYAVLKKTNTPFHFHYITNFAFKDVKYFKVQELLNIIKKYNSSGLIINCSHIPSQLMPYVKQYGDYCCINSRNLK